MQGVGRGREEQRIKEKEKCKTKRIKGDTKWPRKQKMDGREKKRKQGKAEFELPLSGSETDT